MGGDGPTRVGVYEIIREIGRGGMGVVYLARDTTLDRSVAIKSLPDHLADDPARLARFDREARSLAQLNHPNTAGIHGLEEQDGQKYLVLEYVDGDTLEERLGAGPIPLAEALEIAIEIAKGMEAAHDAGVIHRDLKPDNVKITTDGKVKVLDFGVAKVGGSSVRTSTADASTLAVPRDATSPGVIVGTAAYMSPEQARGRGVDKRADIWSFGVVLYEMLTGASPFAGDTVNDSIGAVLHKDADIDRLPATTPTMVRRVLRRCLEREKTRRYHDFGDVRLDLEEAATGSEPDAATAGRRPSLLAVIAVIALIVTSLALGWSTAARRAAPRPLVHSSILAPEGITIDEFQISPDGAQISIIGVPAEIGAQPGPRAGAVYVRALSSGTMTKVPMSDGAFVHRYSSDGRTLAFITRGAESSSVERVMCVPADLSSAPVEVLRVPAEFRWGATWWFCWTPGDELAFIDRTDMVMGVFDAGTGRELRRVELSSDQPKLALSGLVGPFGDRHLAVLVEQFTAAGFRFDTALIDVETGRMTIVIEDASLLTLTPRGNVLFSRRDTIYLSPFDPAARQLTGRFHPVQTGLATMNSWRNGDYDLSGDGTLVYRAGGVEGESRRIVFVERDGRKATWFDEQRAFEDIAISPDGSRLAVLIAGPGGLYELWVSEVERPRLRQLLAESGTDYYKPVFTPDGEHVVVSSWSPSGAEAGRMLVVRFDGTEAPRRVHGGWARDNWPVPASVSPDGARLLIRELAGGRTSVSETRLDGDDRPRVLLEERAIFSARYAPVEVPLVAYVSTETGRAEAYVRTVDEDGVGPALPVTTRGAWNLEWAVDADRGLCILHFDLEWREWITPITVVDGRVRVGESTPTGRIGDVRYEDRSATRDGRYVAIRRGEDERPATHLELVQGWLDTIDER